MGHVPVARWMAGNTGATVDGPCMFDPASFFGHSEFELAIMDMFGGFQEAFWEAYHAKVGPPALSVSWCCAVRRCCPLPPDRFTRCFCHSRAPVLSRTAP